jgi:phytoene dehydrogenase-like protein
MPVETLKNQPAKSGSQALDALVIGSGPNGLASAITLARRGLSVSIIEGQEQIGGGLQSAALTLPGYVHDICATILPLSLASPFFKSLPLAEYGIVWIESEIPLAHPFDDGTAAVLYRSVSETAATLGRDARAYEQLIGPLVMNQENLMEDILRPLHLPRHPLLLADFARHGLRSAKGLAGASFITDKARSLFAGLSSHAMMPLEKTATAAFGLILAMLGHAVGWPIVQGGSQRLADAMQRYFKELGGEVITGLSVTSLDDLPNARALLFDLTPRQILHLADRRFPRNYCRQLQQYRYGPGVFKIDWALREPIPWRATACMKAGTVHLGGMFEEIATSEREVSLGRHPDRPYVIVAQQSLFDSSRAPAGRQTAWAYCHVPNGSGMDMTARIEAQIERFAPGFRELILARHSFTAVGMEQHNPNYVGGDINGGVQDLRQLFARPAMRLVPYSTPDAHIFICSSATPPGGGVHGLCGLYAAEAVLKHFP